MASLFLDNIFNGNYDSPSRVVITMPYAGSNAELAKIHLIGLMTGDPSFSAGNKWGTIINDLSNLTDFSSLIGSDNMWSWIGASTMCWKGTNPLSVGFEFYLINYSPSVDLKTPLKTLVKFAALNKSDAQVSAAQVTAHGGYAADVLDSNGSFFSKTPKITDLKSLGQASDLADIGKGSSLLSNGQAKGALQVQFGKKLLLRNLLLSKIDVNASNIEVADQNGGDRRPLFYRVQVQFTGVRPLLTTDVDYMFSI